MSGFQNFIKLYNSSSIAFPNNSPNTFLIVGKSSNIGNSSINVSLTIINENMHS